MAFRRVHVEALVQICKDRARQQVVGEADFSQDDDNLTLIKGPFDITLAADAAATQIDLPQGAASLRFLAVYDVDAQTGINIHLDASDADEILVMPPTTTDAVGFLLLTTDATTIYVSKPSASADVSATLIFGCSAT